MTLKEFTQLCYTAHLQTFANDGSLPVVFDNLDNSQFKMCKQTFACNLYKLLYED